MIARILTILLLVVVLAGLITYSQLRVEPNHVSGMIEAEEIRLGSRVGGRVQEVLVEEGQQVEREQILVRLEPFDLEQQREEARATLAAREAELRRLEAGLRAEEIGQAQARYEQLQARLDQLVAGPRPQEIDAARSRLRVAEAQLRLASQNYDRIQGLASTNAFTKEEYDRATEGLESAKATVGLRQEELSLVEAGTRAEEIRGAQAQVEEARLAWQLARRVSEPKRSTPPVPPAILPPLDWPPSTTASRNSRSRARSTAWSNPSNSSRAILSRPGPP